MDQVKEGEEAAGEEEEEGKVEVGVAGIEEVEEVVGEEEDKAEAEVKDEGTTTRMSPEEDKEDKISEKLNLQRRGMLLSLILNPNSSLNNLTLLNLIFNIGSLNNNTTKLLSRPRGIRTNINNKRP